MVVEAQFLIPQRLSASAAPLLRALARAARDQGDHVFVRDVYRRGCAGPLVLYGVGAPDRHRARLQHMRSGHRAILWDVGYFGKRKRGGYSRFSIDQDHPDGWLDGTAPDDARWRAHGIELREDADPEGPIILVGLGRKARSYLGCGAWEAAKLAELRRRFPGRRIVHRPKPNQDFEPIPADDRDQTTPIERLLRGASLVVARHSNVCIDAVIAGVPFECEAGAAVWLRGREFSPSNRLDLLHRLSWWQWREAEADQAWQFIKRKIAC